MRFRLVWHDTEDPFKYEASGRYEFFGNRESIYRLWLLLTRIIKARHTEIFSLDGRKQEPEKGIVGLTDYNI